MTRTGRALFAAELARRRTFLLLGLALGVAGPWLATLALTAIGGAPPAPEAGYALATALGSVAWADLLALAALAYALLLTTDAFPRQRDAGTDEFLAALPVSPGAIFGARAASCAVAVLLSIAARHGFFLAHYALAGAWPPGFGADLALPILLLDLFAGVVTLGLALAFAHWRRLGVLVLGVIVLALRLSTHHGVLPIECDMLQFAAPRLVNAAVWLPGALSVGAWLCGAAFASWWGYTLFRDRRDPLGAIDRSLRQGVLVPRLAAGASALLSVVIPLALLAPEVDAGPALVTYPTQRVTSRTRHYRFSYPARDADRVRALVNAADELYEGVARALGASVAADRLDVALTPQLLGPAPDRYRFTLARFTTRELLERETGGRLRAWGSAGRALREGVSRSVALHVAGEDPFGSRFHAAILHSRRPLSLDDVLDCRDLVRDRGPEAVAPLGDAFVAALRGLYGEGALPKLLAAVRGLPGSWVARSADASRARWSELAAAAGVDLTKLDTRLVEIIEDAAYGDERAQIALPRLSSIMETQDKPAGRRVLAIPDQDLPDGWYVVCRVRRAAPGRPEVRPLRAQRLGADAKGCHVFFVRSSAFENAPWIQLGLRAVDALPNLDTIWESWTAPNGTP